jgi:hypothetical protein
VQFAEKLFDKYAEIRKKTAKDYDADEKTIIEFILRIYEFYKLYDIHEGTNHSYIFELLFLNIRKISNEAIARKAFISLKTLYRYKIQYFSFMSDILQTDILGEEFHKLLNG